MKKKLTKNTPAQRLFEDTTYPEAVRILNGVMDAIHSRDGVKIREWRLKLEKYHEEPEQKLF